MSGWFAASLPVQRIPLAIGLCLLAILFALEAKTAWYGPAAGPGCDIRAAKAWPAGSPKVVNHGVPSPDPAHPGVHFAVLLASSMAPAPRIHPRVTGDIPRNHLPFFSLAHFSPSIFFRPPPAL
jgi:hypothetical protein